MQSLHGRRLWQFFRLLDIVRLLDISRLSGLAAFPAFFGLATLSEPLLLLVFGPQWVGAAPVLSVLAMIGAYLCIEKVNQSFCLAAGKAGAVTLLSWVEVVLASGLIWLGSRWGITAVGAAFLLSLCIELVQPLLPTARMSDITDLICNTAGGLIGYGLYRPWKKALGCWM